jgi:hypothetical protein
VYHRNERSLSGLFREGFAHGFHIVHLNKKHRTMLEAAGIKRINPRSYRLLGRGFARAVTGPRRYDAACYCVFNIGKRMGKLSGSARFADLDL